MADYRSQLLDQQPFGGPLTGSAQPSALALALAGTPSFPDGSDPMAAATSYLSSIASPTPAPAPQQPYRGAILPISSGDDGQIHFDSNAGLLGAVKNAFTLPHDVYAGQVDPMSQEGISRAANMVGTLGMGAPATAEVGAAGAFGGRLSGAQQIASQNRFVSNLQKGADDAAKQHVLGLIPPPTSILHRAVRGTAGMSVDDIMASEPLWGYSNVIATANGTEPHEAFSSLANQLFAAHGHDAYLTPDSAKLYMQMQRLEYGQNPGGP